MALPGPKPSNSSLSTKKNARFLFRNTGTFVYFNAFRILSLRSLFDNDRPSRDVAFVVADDDVDVVPSVFFQCLETILTREWQWMVPVHKW